MKVLLRQLTRPRAFFLTVVATLAVGTGATTAIFSTVNATLLRPLPYPDAEDIYELTGPYVDGRASTGLLTGAYVAGVNEGAPSVARATLLQDWESVLLSEDGANRQILMNSVSEGFFDVFGVPIAIGRTFTAEDHASGAVVLSHRLWTEQFGADPEIVGRTLNLTDGPLPIVGVAAPDFDVPPGTDAWFSFHVPPTNLSHSFESYLRVVPGTKPSVLQEELDAVMADLIQTYPQAATGRRFFVTPLVASLVGDLGSILVVVLGGALMLLLVGSVNVATLLLARGVSRTKNVAVRVALGADRWSIVRRLLGEAFLLAVVGGLLGLALAWLGVRALGYLGATSLPRLDHIPFDYRVLVFAGATLPGITLLTGLLPAIVLARPDIRGLLNETGRSNARSRGSRRALSGLVIAEVALAIPLIAGAGLLVRSYVNLSRTDLGFDPDGRLAFVALLGGTKWAPRPVFIQGPDGRRILDPDQPPSESPHTWFDQVSSRLLASGQIEAVGSARTLPLGTEFDGGVYAAANDVPYDPDRRDAMRIRGVSQTFFDAMGMRLLRGRGFRAEEDEPAAIVNETFARRFFPGQDPLDKTFSFGFPEINFDFRMPIIGVVEDAKYASLQQPAGAAAFVLAYGPRQTVVIKTTLDNPSPLIPTVRAEVAMVDPAVPVRIEALSDIVDTQLIRQRMGLLLMLLFAAMSLALAAIGIYGVVSNQIAQRRSELATRAAFGATPSGVSMLIMKQGAALAAEGTAIGLAIAYVGGRLAASRLFEVRAFDPTVVGLAVITVLGSTLLAFVIPALQAGRREPSDGLRAE